DRLDRTGEPASGGGAARGAPLAARRPDQRLRARLAQLPRSSPEACPPHPRPPACQASPVPAPRGRRLGPDSARTRRARAPGAGAGGEREAAIAQSVDQARALWRIRESIPEAQFSNVKHDISVPVSKIPDFVARAGAALEKAFGKIDVYCFGHVGDGNLHYNV